MRGDDRRHHRLLGAGLCRWQSAHRHLHLGQPAVWPTDRRNHRLLGSRPLRPKHTAIRCFRGDQLITLGLHMRARRGRDDHMLGLPPNRTVTDPEPLTRKPFPRKAWRIRWSECHFAHAPTGVLARLGLRRGPEIVSISIPPFDAEGDSSTMSWHHTRHARRWFADRGTLTGAAHASRGTLVATAHGHANRVYRAPSQIFAACEESRLSSTEMWLRNSSPTKPAAHQTIMAIPVRGTNAWQVSGWFRAHNFFGGDRGRV
jgi:hypothetical protein